MTPATPLPLAAGEHPPVPGAVKLEVLDDGSQHHHSARTKARKAALDILYDAEVTSRDAIQLLSEAGEVRPLTNEIVTGVTARGYSVDREITLALMGDWTLQRMPAIDLSLARLATWEIMYTRTPPAAVIAEAVGLADEYSTDASAGFLSAVLGRVAEARHPEEPATPSSARHNGQRGATGGSPASVVGDSEDSDD